MQDLIRGKQPSVVTPQQQFAQNEGPQIQRSSFDRSHGHKTTLDAGILYPIYMDEALPGDTFKMNSTVFGRFATPIKPLMDNVFIDMHFFSVPYRLVWDNWQKFNGEQDNPDDTTDYLIPTTNSGSAGGYGELGIHDYFGLPTKVENLEHSVLPLRAYNLIWNEWYRDQNIQDSVTVNKGDGPDPISDYALLPRGKRKDYFTSSLPFAQKADPVSLPLGDTAPIQFEQANASNQNWVDVNGIDKMGSGLEWSAGILQDNIGQPGYIDLGDSHNVDLSNATAATINAIREAFQVQRMYERDARGGTRYIELIKSHFGVESPDARLQRPEYLGGGTTPLNLHPVPQTSETDTNTPQGNLAAVGTFSADGNGFQKSFTEHEIIIGLISVRADLNYQKGLDRMWSRSTRFDFYWPTFAHLGEQAVLNKEIYAQGTQDDDGVFGYQERYAEYRYKPSQITGLYRSNATNSLDLWHLAQDFTALPALNSSFIEENPPIDRAIAVPSEPQFLIDCYFDLTTARPMPTFATPGLIDHF